MTTQVVNLQENLVKFDNLLTALNYLIEEVQVRKEQAVRDSDILGKVQQEMNTSTFKDNIIEYIRNNYGRGLYQEVAFLVMEKIDDDIERFINARVDERLNQLGVNPQDAAANTAGG